MTNDEIQNFYFDSPKKKQGVFSSISDIVKNLVPANFWMFCGCLSTER